jgi:hypothetical protein
LTEWGAAPPAGGATFSTARWLDEPDAAVIVYGTAGDTTANRAAALALQTAARVHHGNVVVPVCTDAEAGDAELAGRQVVLVGRPATNGLARRWAAAWPVAFGAGSVRVGAEDFAHAGTAVVAAGTNPLDRARSVVLVAGLSAEATYRLAEKATFPAAEVSVYPAGGPARHLVVTRPNPASGP